MSSIVEVQTESDVDAEAIRIRNERVMANQGLVWSVAKAFLRRYRHLHIEMEELVGYGNIGLICAADRFEDDRKVRFSTYATYWIRQSIFLAVEDFGRPIRLPAHTRKEIRRFREERERLRAETGMDPLPGTVMDAMGLPRSMRAHRRRVWASVSAACARFGEVPVEEVAAAMPDGTSPPSAAIDAEGRERLSRALAMLPEERRRLIVLRYGLDGNGPRDTRTLARSLDTNWHTARRKLDIAIREMRRLMDVEPRGETDE
jgi:RNA polymerase primary sigma factor